MTKFFISIAAIMAGLSVAGGAFASHALKDQISERALEIFETGSKYQMYHALLLLLIGFFLKFETGIEKTTAWFIILGTFLFSVSIYFLSFQDILKTNLKFLGPITPIGGLFMILGWALLIYVFAKTKF